MGQEKGFDSLTLPQGGRRTGYLSRELRRFVDSLNDISVYLDLESLLPPGQAARFVGWSTATIRRYRKAGLIPGFQIPSSGNKRPIWRYRLKDLLSISNARVFGSHFYDPRLGGELPVALVARLTGLSEAGVDSAIAAGRLLNRTPESIQLYLLSKRKIAASRNHRAKMSSLQTRLRQTQRLLREGVCQLCHRRGLGRPHPLGITKPQEK